MSDKNSNGAGCLFCKIIAGEIPSSKVYEDEKCYAFLDLHPVNIGHTLLVPKEHSTNLYDTSDENLAHLAPIMKKLAIAVKSAVGAGGINIEMNNDPVAGQLIFHTHIHIVPRFTGDGFTHWKGSRGYNEDEMQEVAGKISQLI